MSVADDGRIATPVVRFPDFPARTSLDTVAAVLQDLALVYEVSAAYTLPGYGHVQLPVQRLGPRRRSMLEDGDRLPVKQVSFGSPLEIIVQVLVVASVGTGSLAYAVQRLGSATKTWIEVLVAGVDLDQRQQALEEARATAPERLRGLQLGNDLLEQQVRRARTEADIAERDLSAGIRSDPAPSASPEPPRDALTPLRDRDARDVAELLAAPAERLLDAGGGTLEVITGYQDPSR